MKINLDYYTRRTDAHRHPKFKTLRLSYNGGTEGWAAEGRFWALNDIIADSEMCQIDLSKKRNKADIAECLGFTLVELDYFVQVLISDDVELLFEVEPGVYSTKKVRETLETVLIERDKARDRYGKKPSQKETKTTTSGEKEETSPNFAEKSETSGEVGYRVKESKVKESKLNESKGKGEIPSPENEETLSYVFEDKLTPYFFTFLNFYDDYVLRKTLDDMLSFFCQYDTITKATKTRLFNIVTGTENLPRDLTFKTSLKTLEEYKALPTNKRNLPYLFSRIEGKIKDAAIIYREEESVKLKNDEKRLSVEFLETNAESEENYSFSADLKDLINSKKVI